MAAPSKETHIVFLCFVHSLGPHLLSLILENLKSLLNRDTKERIYLCKFNFAKCSFLSDLAVHRDEMRIFCSQETRTTNTDVTRDLNIFFHFFYSLKAAPFILKFRSTNQPSLRFEGYFLPGW